MALTIHQRPYSTIDPERPFPVDLYPIPEAEGSALGIMREVVGESPEALRGFLHGLDLAVSQIYRLQALTTTEGIAVLQTLMTVVFFTERSDEYAAAVALLDRWQS
jgi:hypothetical protein